MCIICSVNVTDPPFSAVQYIALKKEEKHLTSVEVKKPNESLGRHLQKGRTAVVPFISPLLP